MTTGRPPTETFPVAAGSSPNSARATSDRPAPDHHLHQRCRIKDVGGLRGHVPAVSQHRDRVAQAEDLLHAMRHVDRRDALPAKPRDELV
jgi:hypothetical protein